MGFFEGFADESGRGCSGLGQAGCATYIGYLIVLCVIVSLLRGCLGG